MARPEILFPLFGELTGLRSVGPKTAALLTSMGVHRPVDLLFTLPHSVIDRVPRDSVMEVVPPAVATVTVRVIAHDPPNRAGRPYRVTVEDAGTRFQLVFFRPRIPWLKQRLPVGADRIVSGKVDLFDGVPQITHPDHILDLEDAETLPKYEPIYPLTAGLTARNMQKAASASLTLKPDLQEWIDPHLLKARVWPSWGDAIAAAHQPQGAADLAPDSPARQRLAYDELLAHQLTLAIARRTARRRSGQQNVGDGHLQERVRKGLGFDLTGAQKRAVSEIGTDMASEQRMSRLLQGDVGSGKTLVALFALLQAVEAGGQGALMAPTEILARQHFAALSPLAQVADTRFEILTGRDSGAERKAKLQRLADGQIDILVGTHALFQADVVFGDLRLAIIDEQHRFGVAQRLELGRKGASVDVLVMTATPIPRSLAMTQYGDLDVSILDEKPPGRKPIQTAVLPDDRLDDVIAHLDRAMADGRQAYWVCPLVDEAETVDLVAAEARARQLAAVLGHERVGLVHGQMPSAEKDAVMARFAKGELSLLVATTVIEVGVNVPNASIMVIDRADSFGLAQLHQLRGRVGRGTAASTCLLLYRAPLTKTAEKRLTLMRETEDGFRLAEEDMTMRGAGDLIGQAQSGVPRFRIADLDAHGALLSIAQSDARVALDVDFPKKTKRWQSLTTLLWLMQQDRSLALLDVG